MIHEELTALMNGGCTTRRERVASVFAPRWVSTVNARRFVDRRAPGGISPLPPEDIAIGSYDGAVSHVRDLRGYLARHLRTELAGAYVHGSLGTGEQIPYSDFDALAIVRTDVLSDNRRLARTAYHLNVSRKFMLRFDPLQHHGWFVIAESQLRDYPEDFLPVAALREARALLPGDTPALRIVPSAGSAQRARQHGLRMVTTLGRRLAMRSFPRDAYALKVFLSNVMLLPAVYVHARDGRGIFKRESFAAARADFSAGTWASMEDISRIRRDWDLRIDPVRGFLLSRVSPMRRLGKRLAPPIPARIAADLTPAFYERALTLIRAFQERLAAAR